MKTAHAAGTPTAGFAIPACIPSIIHGEAALCDTKYDIPVVYPATEETISHLREADAAQVDAAVRSARDAFEHGPWPRMDVDQRKDVLYAIRDILRANSAELGFLETMNTGLTLANIERHVERMAKNFEFFGEVISTVAGETYTQDSRYLTYVTRQPKGVGAMIAPWNAPLALASMRVVTCIAFGNTCVLKPSEFTPLSIYRMVELMHEAGLPPGVVNLVNGRGSVTGTSLVSHPEIDMVGFTGGTETGKAIMSAAGKALKPAILELGGKSANIIFADADLDRALDGALTGIFANNGQQCLAGSRILVQKSIAEEFMTQFAARARNIRVGDPFDAATEIGPLCYRAHMERVLSYADIARADGAKVLVGGERAPGFDRGLYILPTAVYAPDNRSRVAQEEIFGPFATFLTFETTDEAISIANDSNFGLVAYIWSRDLGCVMRCSRDIRAGTIWVNTPMTRELRAPFGGFKESGVGRDGMDDSLRFFTEAKTTTIPLTDVAVGNFGRG